MTNKLRIDPKKHKHLSKCEMFDCKKTFKTGDIVYKYNHIYDIDDPYEDCSHIEEEYVFCSKECLLDFILKTDNLKILEVELYNENEEAIHKRNKIAEILSNMAPNTTAKYKNVNIYCFNRMGRLNYIINNSTTERLCNNLNDAVRKILYLNNEED